MSMDEQHRELNNFTASLGEFNQQLASSLRDLTERHEAVSPMWQDEMRRGYDAEWIPLNEMLQRYVGVEAGRYMSFLEEKIQAVRRYLYG